MTTTQRARRTAIWQGALFVVTLFLFVAVIGPSLG